MSRRSERASGPESMRVSHAPVTMGSPRSREVDTGAFRVTEAWFAPGAVLEPHTHDRSIFSVMLEGSFETRISGKRLDCVSGTTWTEPRAERHANYGGTRGARVIVTQPSPHRPEMLAPFADLLGSVSLRRDPVIALDARRISAELIAPDTLSPLVLDSLVMLMLGRAARSGGSKRVAPGPPQWLLCARDLIHDEFRFGLSLRQVASEAGVPPWHLAREFRRHFHASVGEYARALRVNWALEQLATSTMPLSEVALSAGFADQSHLTRACRAATGVPAAAYRREARGSAAPTSRRNR